MTISNRCEWTKTTGKRVFRCINRSTKEIVVGSGVLHLCAYHANVVLQLIKRKEQYERLLRATQDEILRTIDEIEKRKRNEPC